MGKSEIFLLLLAIGKFSPSFFSLQKQQQKSYVFFKFTPNPKMKEQERENIFEQFLKRLIDK